MRLLLAAQAAGSGWESRHTTETGDQGSAGSVRDHAAKPVIRGEGANRADADVLPPEVSR